MANSNLVYSYIRNNSSKDFYHTKSTFTTVKRKEISSRPEMKFASHTLLRENEHQVVFQSLPRYEHHEQNVNVKNGELL